jgi:hypothetical protein
MRAELSGETYLIDSDFTLKGTNGNIFGNTRAALAERRLAQNFKFTEKPDESFYDETEGYLTADFDIIRFKFGRDRIRLVMAR